MNAVKVFHFEVSWCELTEENTHLQLKSFDRELEAFENQLYEFPVTFPPSYPFEEKVSCATTYMQTRCPSWCDRVLLSETARTLVESDDKVEYNIMGRETCMGDHKVGLFIFYYLVTFSQLLLQF